MASAQRKLASWVASAASGWEVWTMVSLGGVRDMSSKPKVTQGSLLFSPRRLYLWPRVGKEVGRESCC